MYNIAAVISSPVILDQLASGLRSSTRKVELTESLSLLPLTDAILEQINNGDLNPSVEPFTALTKRLTQILEHLSEAGTIAYIEAEYFGGAGAQGSVVWFNRLVTFREFGESEAINRALRILGIIAISGKDEFDTVGLGRYRKTEDWQG